MPNPDWEVVGSDMPATQNAGDWDVIPDQQDATQAALGGASQAMSSVSPYSTALGPFGIDAQTAMNLFGKNGSGASLSNPFRDLFAGLVGGLGKGGQGIANVLTGGYAPKVDFNQIQSDIGTQNPNFLNRIVQAAGTAIPYTEAGGALGELGGSGIGNAFNMQNLENMARIGRNIGIGVGGGTGAAISSPNHPVLNFLGGALPIGAIASKVFPAPAEQAFEESFVDPEKIAQDVHGGMLGNYNPTQTMKDLASELKSNYESIKGDRQNDYNEIFDSPTKEENYFTGEPFKAKDLDLREGNYFNNNDDYNFEDKNLQKLHKEFINSPDIDNAHQLQSELGSEIGYLKRQKDNGLLDSAGKNKLEDYANMRKSLLDDISSRLEESNPDLAGKYAEATKNWATDVIPYHADKDLRAIVQGKNTSPDPTTVARIFGYPESSMQTVADNLSDAGRQNIVKSGMGVNRYQNTAKDLIRGHNNLMSKGLDQYLNPQDEQSLLNVRNNVSLQKQSVASAKAAAEAAKNASVPYLDQAKNLLGYGAKILPYYGLTAALGHLGVNSNSLLDAMLEAQAAGQGKSNALGR